MNKEQIRQKAIEYADSIHLCDIDWNSEDEKIRYLKSHPRGLYDLYDATVNAFIAGYSLKGGAGTVSEWQLCPKCNGQGTVSVPPWLSGDVNQFTSTEVQFVCDVCNGAKILIKPIISESSPTNPLTGTTGIESNTVVESGG